MFASVKRIVVHQAGLGPVLNRKAQILNILRCARLARHERIESDIPVLAAASVITIIPTVGRASLVDAVASALSQSPDNHQVVVVTDGTHVLPDLPNEVHVLQTSNQCGVVGVVRNIGLNVTQSSFVAFLDDDNTWQPDHLESCLSALAEHRAEIVYASADRFRPDGAYYDTIGRTWDRRLVRHANFVDASTLVAHRFSGLRFSRTPRPPGTQFTEDWELVYRASRRHRVSWTGQATVNYALSPDLINRLDRLKAGEK